MNPMRYIKPAVIGALLLALVVVIVQNTAPVQVRALVFTIEMPLILLLVLTAGASFLVGLLAPALWRPRRTWPRPVPASSGIEQPGQPSGHAADRRRVA
jgi:uncharacterized integral membrane protein